MSKTELVELVAQELGSTKADATRAVDAVIKGIETGVKKAGKVTLVGFGTFEAKKRPARTGRNPRTGEAVKIGARVVPSFKAGSKFKEALN